MECLPLEENLPFSCESEISAACVGVRSVSPRLGLETVLLLNYLAMYFSKNIWTKFTLLL